MKHFWQDFLEKKYRNQIILGQRKDCVNLKKTTLVLCNLVIALIPIIIKLTKRNWPYLEYPLEALSIFLLLFSAMKVTALDYIIDVIDENDRKALTKKEKEEEGSNYYYEALLECCNFAREIAPLLESRYTCGERSIHLFLYKFASSIENLLPKYCKIEKRDFLIHVYMFDKKEGVVERIVQRNFCLDIENANTGFRHKIRDKKTLFFYERVILEFKENLNPICLVDKAEIQRKLRLDNLPDDRIDYCSQYIGYVSSLNDRLLIYTEIISFNQVLLGGTTSEDVKCTVRRVLRAPTAVLDSVNWDLFIDYKEKEHVTVQNKEKIAKEDIEPEE